MNGLLQFLLLSAALALIVICISLAVGEMNGTSMGPK